MILEVSAMQKYIFKFDYSIWGFQSEIAFNSSEIAGIFSLINILRKYISFMHSWMHLSKGVRSTSQFSWVLTWGQHVAKAEQW